MAPVRPRLERTLRRAPLLLAGASLIAALALVVVLSIHSRELRAEVRRLRQRQVEPHAGYWLPVARLPTTAGDSIAIATGAPGHRQVLMYFTTTCQFCAAIAPRWDSITHVLGSAPDVEVIRVAIDSSRLVARWTAAHQPAQRVALLSDERLRRLMRANVVPYTVVVGDSGRVLYGAAGALDRPGQVDSLVSTVRGRR